MMYKYKFAAIERPNLKALDKLNKKINDSNGILRSIFHYTNGQKKILIETKLVLTATVRAIKTIIFRSFFPKSPLID